MIRQKRAALAVIAAAAVLAACGGGSEPQAVTPQAAMKAIQAKAEQLRAEQVPVADAAKQLMNFAEQTFPGLFPPGPADAFAEIFHFRYYPSTNNYLGVSSMTTGPFVASNVYIVGSSFGNTLANPIDMGPLTNYVTPTTPGGGGGGTGNGCFDLSLADTQGTKLETNYNYSGAINGDVQQVTTVGGMVMFEGTMRRETTNVTSGGVGPAAALNVSAKAYQARTGDAEMTLYGAIADSSISASGITTNTSIKTVYNPPYVDSISGLALGASASLTQSGTAFTSITFTGLPLPPQNSQAAINATTTHTYVSRESVTVPAGTFNACKYTAQSGNNPVTTTWYVVGKGVPVKITSGSGNSALEIKATMVKVNNAAL